MKLIGIFIENSGSIFIVSTHKTTKGINMIVLALFPLLFLAVAFIVMSTSDTDIEEIHERNDKFRAQQAKDSTPTYEAEILRIAA